MWTFPAAHPIRAHRTSRPCRKRPLTWISLRVNEPKPLKWCVCPSYGRIAQLVEQLTLNQRVPGSSPGAPTIQIRDRRPFQPAKALTVTSVISASSPSFEPGFTRTRVATIGWRTADCTIAFGSSTNAFNKRGSRSYATETGQGDFTPRGGDRQFTRHQLTDHPGNAEDKPCHAG